MRIHHSAPPGTVAGATDIASTGPLSGLRPREAGYYGLAYMEGRVRHCPTLANLRHELDDDLRARQIAMLRDAGVLGKCANAYTQADFVNLTRAALSHDVGNCAERAFVVARALVESGYPHPIEILSFIGEKDHADRLDHAVVRLHGTTPDACFWIDPFIQKLRPDEQKALTGAAFQRGVDHPAAFSQATASANLFCYVAHDAGEHVSLQRASEIEQAFDLSISARLTRTSSGAIRFQSGADLRADSVVFS